MFAPYARTSANLPGIIDGGLLSSTDLQLSAASSGLVVNISTGEAIVGGTEGGAQGGYYARATSTTSLTLATANVSNPRIDLICLTVDDQGYTPPSGGTGGAVTAQVITGSPTTGATLINLLGAGTLPGSSLLLGYALVPAAATSLTSGDISNVAAPVLTVGGLSPSIITSSGSVTIPAGAGNMKVTLVGGGGGGGGVGSGSSNGGGGGGGGGQFLQSVVALAGVSGLAVTIGAAGGAGAATPTAGGAGGATTLTGMGLTTLTAEGGGGGAAGVGGVGGSYGGSPGTSGPGFGGAGEGGGAATAGSAGIGIGSAGGGGGGTAGSAGGSPGGGGGGGTAAGSAATGYGNGGGGGGTRTGGSAAPGGSGSAGVAIFEWLP